MLNCNISAGGSATTVEAGTVVGGSEMVVESTGEEHFHCFPPSSVAVTTTKRFQMIQTGQSSSKTLVQCLPKTRCSRLSTQAELAEVSNGSAGARTVGPVLALEMQRLTQTSSGSTMTGCCTRNGKSAVEAPRQR